jgi:beta-glucanase (GH16 family)
VASNTGACGVGLYNNNITDSSQNVGSSQDISQGRSFQPRQIGYGELDPNQDSDGDGVLNFYDRFPFDPGLTIDTDMDGIANELDSDDDGDGFNDSYDCAPLDKNVRNCILNCEFDSNNIDNNGLFSGVSVSENHQTLDSSTASYLDFNIAKWLPNQSGEVQIPSQIEQIGYRAFNGLDITSVDIPDSVTIIQSMAFQNNSRLTEVNFGDAITKIGPYAFEQTAIKNVTLPDTVTQIGHYAFANSDIEQIYLGNSVEHIGDFAFASAKISTLIIPSTVKSIGDNAFDYLDGNVFVIAPADQWVSIFDFPSTANFFTCLGLDINGDPEQCSSSYELVSNNVFDRPAALRYLNDGHITIPDTYHRIGERAFEELQGILSSVTIPETITHIGDYAFKDLGLTTILLPDSIISIGNGAFAGNQLSNISLPNNLMNVGYAAFAGNNLGFIVLPANLEEVGAGAFINSSLNTVIFPEGLARIEQNAFANNAITNINLPSSLHYIGDGAFENNQIISAVFKANGSIGQNAFANNPFITVTLANGVTSPGGYDRQKPIITMNEFGEKQVIQTVDNQIIYENYDRDWNWQPILPINGTLLGYKEIHSQAEEYSDGGATASSYYFGEITIQTSGEIDTNIAGIQIVTYTATDPFGNSSFFERHIEIVDNTPPAITLNGSSTLVVESNANFEEPGATAFDKVDDQFIDIHTTLERCEYIEENECQSGQMVAAVDTGVPGTYLIKYSASDSAGNIGTATRQIIVLQGFNDEVVVFRNSAFGTDFGNGIYAFDEALDWGAVNNSGDAPSIDWEMVNVPGRGDVIQVTHADDNLGAGIFIQSTDEKAINLLGSKVGGIVQFDIKIISGDPNITIKAGCGYPCGAGPRNIGEQTSEWKTYRYPVVNLLPGGNDGSTGLELGSVTTGLEIWATGQRATVFQIDNISWQCVESCEGEEFVPDFTPWDKVDITNGYDALPTSYEGYDLFWSDEFNGTEVDTTKWGFDLGNVSPEGNVGWGNSELQYYRPENATVADGMLTINAEYHQPRLEEVNGNPVPAGVRYTSAKLLTKGKFSFQYGRVDIRAVVAEGKGLWSAGWMLGDNQSTIGWPRAGEIDIVDTIGGPGQEDMIVNNMYWNPEGPSQPANGKANINENGYGEVLASDISDIEGETFSNTFHVFSIIWTEDSVDFYVDGQLTTPMPLTGSLKDTFTQSPFYLILNVAIGGTWPGAPVFEDTDTPTQFPRGMLVDYVRVYKPTNN